MKDFYRGFAAAVATVARDQGNPTQAKDVMTLNGVTLQMLRDARVDKFDLEPIRKAMERSE